MPTIKKNRPCCIPYCKNKATHGYYCDTHYKPPKDTRKPVYDRPGYGPEWKEIRNEHLKLNPYCVDCAKLGINTKATDVHHKEGVSGGHRKLTSLCAKHHGMRRATECAVSRGTKRNLIIVFGPPCSGKSYHINQIKKDTDIVICRDIIATELTGQTLHGLPIGMFSKIDSIYQQRLSDAIKNGGRVYVPTTKLHRLRPYFKAIKKIIILIPSRVQCYRYAEADDTRINKDEWRVIVGRWYRWWAATGATNTRQMVQTIGGVQTGVQLQIIGENNLWKI